MNGVVGVMAMDENDGDIRSPMRRLGSTRKLLIFNNIRLQLNEQLRCLDVRMESQVSLIQELQDFFRRRGEVELDYSKSLDKLAKSLQLRHKEQKHKREQWPMFSSYACWQQLVNQTKSLSKDHAALSEIYSTHLVSRLQTVVEDVQRIYKKCREIGYETHEEILRVLQELHTTMKTYHSYQTECKAAEVKMRTAEQSRLKLQQSIPKEKLERSKKYRMIEKEMLKRQSKYTDARLKALKARNEYQLCLEASNTTIHKYFVEDLSDLIDCMDLGFHSMVSRALLMHVTADQGRCRSVLHNADTLSHTVHSMDSRADKQKFLEQHHGAFMIPKRLEFQGQPPLGEDVVEPELQKALHAEMESRLVHLGQRVGNLRMESEEIWKTLETAEINLLEILNTKDYDSSSHFGDSTTQSAQPESLTVKLKTDKQEIEEFYITKIREYILGTSRIARLDSKAELLRNALVVESALHGGGNSTLLAKALVPKRKRIGRMNMTGQPKLFGGSLEEYLEVTGEEIPLIMRSCIRIINLYGLHHQGIFRVSGSQVEISNFREGFERGEDPLADTTDASDINSVAGVLKLYLRELREPLFPIIYFDHFVALAQMDSKHELVQGIRKFLQSLPRAVIIVIRYLFAFLNHLSEYSDENMMDAYNLAICFGPTLMPAPEDKDQVQYQNQVNELIKNLIVFHSELFPKDLGGYAYEKYISTDPFDGDVGDSPTEQIVEDPDSEVYPSEDESDTMEATAQFDFIARSNRELSLRKGDLVILRKQVSNDWWQGTVKGKDGLVPDKYISLKIKDEDRDKCSDHLKSSSSEESVRKRRPSGNLSMHSALSVFNTPATAEHIGGTVEHATSSSSASSSIKTTHVIKPSDLAAAAAAAAAVQHAQHHHPHHGGSVASNSSSSSSGGGGGAGVAVLLRANTTAGGCPSTDKTDKSVVLGLQQAHAQATGGGGHKAPLTVAASLDATDSLYDTVDNVKSKYNYHDEPHSFESSMEFLEDFNHFPCEANRKRSEPIYAEPSKMPAATASAAITNTKANAKKPDAKTVAAAAETAGATMRFAEYDGSVQLRNTAPPMLGTAGGRSAIGAAGLNGSPTMELKRKSEQIRPSPSLKLVGQPLPQNIYANTQPLLLTDNTEEPPTSNEEEPYEGVELRSHAQQVVATTAIDGGADAANLPRRKFHSKSLSMSENQIMAGFAVGGGSASGAAGLNLFHQNRELWEKRAELQSQQCLNTQRILSRHRIAPDLVMDLPFQADGNGNIGGVGGAGDATAPATSAVPPEKDAGELVGTATGTQAAAASSTKPSNQQKQQLILRDDSVDSIDQLTSAERFAAGNQCTLRKNERFSGDGCDASVLLLHHQQEELISGETSTASSSSIDEEIRLHIDESPETVDEPLVAAALATGALKPEPMYADVRKSPIPQQNTKKFVTKFADLHLTGGCLTGSTPGDPTTASATAPSSATTSSSASANAPPPTNGTNAGAAFSSFKPQVKVKPALLKKPLVVMPPSTPEMGRRATED